LEFLDLIVSTILPIIDVVLAAGMLYYAYKYLRGTSAIIIFRGFILVYIIWWVTDIANMNILSNILGGFISVGVFALIIVFQQEIRTFLLMLGSNRFTNNKSVIKRLKLLFKISQEQSKINIDELFSAIESLINSKTGALIVFERNTNLDFVKSDADILNAELSSSLIESIFFKNSPLHDGAIIIEGNVIKSSRVTLPITKKTISKSYGLRHKAAVGITEDTDAISLVISEETGKVSYIQNGAFIKFKNLENLKELIINDLAN
tara:strand:+ start:687 stop:1475 length:789 start_codon:yes stop_codon:yes gene_type:complete